MSLNILEILSDLVATIGPPRADNDNSIVGESPIEQGLSRFWQRIGIVLLLAVAAGAIYVWVISPRRLDSPPHPTPSTQSTLIP